MSQRHSVPHTTDEQQVHVKEAEEVEVFRQVSDLAYKGTREYEPAIRFRLRIPNP